MSSKGKCILKKRKEIIHEKLNEIFGESENAIDLIQDMQIWATSIVSSLDLETDEREFLLKYPVVAKKLEEWQAHISRISFELDVLVCEENRRAREESDITSTTPEHKTEVQYKVKKVPKALDVPFWRIPCPLQENDILDMRYISGDTPHDFWLRFYSTEELKIRSGIQQLFEENKLRPVKSSEVIGSDVSVCNGSDYFRGRVINQCTDSPCTYSVLNVDNGCISKVEKDKIYHLTKELAKVQVQAINCCLDGVLWDPALWDDCVVKLFHQIMEDSTLVVTICSVPKETSSKFVVKVDAHNKMYLDSKVDLSSWITNSLLPTMVQRRTSQSSDNLESLFASLHTKSELENSTSLMKNSTTEPWDLESKENKISRDSCVAELTNGTCNSKQSPTGALQQSNSFLSLNSVPLSTQKDKSDMQQSNSLLSFNGVPMHTLSSQKEKSDMQQSPTNEVQQLNSILSLNSTAVHAVLSQKEKPNLKQSPTSMLQKSNSFLNLNGTGVQAMPSENCSAPQSPISAALESNPFLSLGNIPVHTISLPKELSSAQQSPNAVQESNSFLNLSNIPVHTLPLQKEQSSAAQESKSFVSLSNTPMHTMPPQKEKSSVPQLPTNAVQQSNSFLSLSTTPLSAMPPQNAKPNVQQCVPSVHQSFLNLMGAGSQYFHHLMPYQNPPMLVPMGPSSAVTQPVYPYPPRMQQPFIGIPHFPNALQQQPKPHPFQLQIPSPAQNKLLLKHGSAGQGPAASTPKPPQSSTQQTPICRDCRSRSSVEKNQKGATWVTHTLSATHHKTETAAAQTPSTEPETIGEDASVHQRETSPQKINPRVNRVSLKHPDFKFEIGARYKAFVVHINDPDDFYVHVACLDTAFIENLDAEMTENYRTCSVKLKSKEQAKMMLYESWCAVYYEDEHMWHRGKVVDWMDDETTTLKVQYVDYGEVRKVELNMIKPLKAEYTKLPICATRCRLAKIHPPRLQENYEANIWPSETIELFKVLAVREKFHSIVVINISTDPISVLLVSDDNVVINQTLLEYDYAVAFEVIEFDPSLPFQLIKKDEENAEKVNGRALDSQSETSWKEDKDGDVKMEESVQTVNDDLQNWDPMREDFFSADNTEHRDDENACYAVSGYVPRDEQRICKFYAESGRCFKGVTCTKEHSMPNPDGWTTDREAVLQDTFNILVLPPVGTVVVVEATAIYTVNMFNAHVHWEGRVKEGEETLTTLNKYINDKNNVSKMKRPQVTPAVGQLVLAKFVQGADINFFRARVIDTNIEQYEVQVMYIDYGNIEWVSEKDIREMEPQYLHLPPQAVECYISNVSPKTDSEKALHYVSELILGKQLVATLVSKNILGHAEMELWDGDDKIADKLIEKGYADYRESSLFCKEDAPIIPG